jgi:hypothetical protein
MTGRHNMRAGYGGQSEHDVTWFFLRSKAIQSPLYGYHATTNRFVCRNRPTKLSSHFSLTLEVTAGRGSGTSVINCDLQTVKLAPILTQETGTPCIILGLWARKETVARY